MPWTQVLGQVGAVGVFVLACLFLFLKYYPFHKKENGNGNGKSIAVLSGLTLESVQKIFEIRVEALEKEMNIRFQDHERRIEKHQKELREENDTLSKRIMHLSDRVAGIERK